MIVGIWVTFLYSYLMAESGRRSQRAGDQRCDHAINNYCLGSSLLLILNIIEYVNDTVLKERI